MKTLKDFLNELKIRKSELARAKRIADLFQIQTIDGDYVSGAEALTEGQLEIFYAIIFRPHNRININCCTQYGKKIADSIPVWTTKGWKDHGKLKAGDFVFSDNGQQVKIKNVFNDGVDCKFEIEFTNGEKIKCHGKHEWMVKHRGWKEYRKIETETLLAYKNLKDFKIPKIKPLSFKKKKLPVDPYTFGAWLGDGTQRVPVITNSIQDRAVIENIPYKISSQSIHKKTGVYTVRYGRNGISEYLKSITKKHIPVEYKTSSVEQRLELLAGLIDTDGSVNKQTRANGRRNGRVYFVNSNKELIKDFCDLVQGLGMRTSTTKVKPSVSSSGIVGKQDVYYVGFQANINIPTKIKRKKIVSRETRGYRIKAIKKIKAERGKCIEVEGGIYLVGKKLIPTHNSLTVALACVYLTTIKGIKVAVVAPSDKKTKLIMRYYIEHLGDCQLYACQLEANTRLERLKQEGSKERIILRNGGGIYTISSQAANSVKSIEAAMGEGAEVVILDEACLTPDETEATIFRMISGQGAKGCYVKIGNPFYSEPPNEHFYKSSYDPNYLQIFIDYRQALKEGRYTPEFIEEATRKPMFDILYECLFPPQNEVDEKGYRRLLTLEQIRERMIEKLPEWAEGRVMLGADIGRGGNFNAYVERDDAFMWLHGKNKSNDLMTNVREIEGAKADATFIDDTGVGGGVTDRCIERSIYVTPIRSGGKASEPETFKNVRSELFFRFKQWLLVEGGLLEQNDDWLLLYEIKWKVDSGGRFRLEPKEEMAKRAKRQLAKTGSSSPDVIDAGSFTFADENKPTVDFMEEEKPKKKKGAFKQAVKMKRSGIGI